MRIYNKPEIEITCLNSEDVMAVSGGLVLTNNTNFQSAASLEKKYNVISNF